MALIIGRYNVIYDDEVLVLLQEQLKFSLFEHLESSRRTVTPMMRMATSIMREPNLLSDRHAG